MFTHYPTVGIFLKKENLREADQLLTIYTQDFGKVEVLGRAIRKSQSKLRSGADIFYLSEIEFIQGKSCKILTESFFIEKFNNLRRDLSRLKIAYKVSEVFNELVTNQQPDEEIWQLLMEVFHNLNDKKTEFKDWKWAMVYYYFLWNLLSSLGYRVDLYRCSACQKKLMPDGLYFNESITGIICPDCLDDAKNSTGTGIETDIIKILRILLKKDWLMVKKLKLKETDLSLLDYISNKYLTAILDRM